MNEQPKDYAELEQMYDRIVQQALDEASIWTRIVFYLQAKISLVIFSSILLGYMAGMHFGKFW